MNRQPPASTNVVWHHATVTRARREAQNGHRGAIIWFTGLSGSGKSTLAHAVEESLHQRGCRTFVMDGDNVRHDLCSDLGFSSRDRHENIRRIGEAAKLFLEAGVIVLTAFISPYRVDRDRVRGMVAHGDFVEIYCDASIEICEARDVKGIYKKARAGKVAEFTGISSPYDVPINPELSVNTGSTELNACVQQVIGELMRREIISTTSLSRKGGKKKVNDIAIPVSSQVVPYTPARFCFSAHCFRLGKPVSAFVVFEYAKLSEWAVRQNKRVPKDT